MKSELSLDTPYRISPRIVSSIKSADSMAVFGAGPPFELPLDLFRVLMMFSETTTTRHVFHALDVDVDIEHFARIIAEFLDRGLLRCVQRVDDDQGLGQLLNPSVFSDPAAVGKIGDQLRQGRAVVIPDALPAALAERVYHDLDRSTSWIPTEGAHDFFHHRNCMIEATEEHSPALLHVVDCSGAWPLVSSSGSCPARTARRKRACVRPGTGPASMPCRTTIPRLPCRVPSRTSGI